MITYQIPIQGQPVNFTVREHVRQFAFLPDGRRGVLTLQIWRQRITCVDALEVKVEDLPMTAIDVNAIKDQVFGPTGLRIEEIMTIFRWFFDQSVPIPAEAINIVRESLPTGIQGSLDALQAKEDAAKESLATAAQDLSALQGAIAAARLEWNDFNSNSAAEREAKAAELTMIEQSVIDAKSKMLRVDLAIQEKNNIIATLEASINEKSNESTSLALKIESQIKQVV